MLQTTRRLRLAAVALATLVGCGGLGFWGANVVVEENASLSKEQKIEDDRIEDKHPVYDPTLETVENFGYCEVTLNKSASVTKLDILPFGEAEASLDGRLFPTRQEAIAAVDALDDADLLPSMEVMNGALKPLNDGVYAALELAVQDPCETANYIGKDALLGRLLAATIEALADASPSRAVYLADAAAFIDAARQLMGYPSNLSGTAATRAQQYVSEFLAAPALSRPIGFYTWKPTLEKVFRQDRFLQTATNTPSTTAFGRWVALAALIESDADLKRGYEVTVSLYAGLTNPYMSYTLVDLFGEVDGLASLDDVAGLQQRWVANHPPRTACTNQALVAFLPASRSKDTEYFCSLPELPSSLMDELIAAIRSGRLDLTPQADSGWYDYQLYALETLLVPERGPESQHLLLTAAYKKKLIETFKSLITQTRETHAKQVGFATTGADPIEVDLYPKFPAEPFPTYYLRTARGYRFLRTFLTALLGPDVISNPRVLESGQFASATVADELDRVASLLYGVFALSCDSLGMRASDQLLAGERTDSELQADKEAAATWLSRWRKDADVLRDPRVIVPAGSDDVSTYYWATIGTKVLKSSAEYMKGYEPTVVQTSCPVRSIVPHDYFLIVEDTVEVAIRREAPPPTRDELRQICDSNGTREAIIHALEAR